MTVLHQILVKTSFQMVLKPQFFYSYDTYVFLNNIYRLYHIIALQLIIAYLSYISYIYMATPHGKVNVVIHNQPHIKWTWQKYWVDLFSGFKQVNCLIYVYIYYATSHTSNILKHVSNIYQIVKSDTHVDHSIVSNKLILHFYHSL